MAPPVEVPKVLNRKVGRNRRRYYLSLVLLLISNLTNELRLHQFLRTKTTVANKS